MRHANRQAFSRALAGVLVEFRDALISNDKHGANLCYTTAIGLVSGAMLSGGMSKAYGQELLTALAETRSSFEAAFGDAPATPDLLLN